MRERMGTGIYILDACEFVSVNDIGLYKNAVRQSACMGRILIGVRCFVQGQGQISGDEMRHRIYKIDESQVGAEYDAVETTACCV